jgi:hypothetical protein
MFSAQVAREHSHQPPEISWKQEWLPSAWTLGWACIVFGVWTVYVCLICEVSWMFPYLN